MRNLGKRLISILLCCCMIIPLCSLQMLGAEASVLYGDADDSGRVDLQDVLLMEKHIAGQAVTINIINADVNSDYVVDKEDVRLVREYLAGNLPGLKPELCTVTFDFGDGTTQDIKVGKGYSIQKEIPSAEKEGFIFAGWQKEDETPFYQEDLVIQDVLLTPVYEKMMSTESLSIDSFALTDQSPSLTFYIEADLGSAEEVMQKLSVVPKDGSDPVEIEVTKEEEGIYAVKARDGFTAGASYALTLEDPLSFAEKEPAIRTAFFIIAKEQKDVLRYNDSLLFIQDTDQMNYDVDGEITDMLELGLFTNDTENKKIEGTFIMPDTTLQAGDYVCLYEITHPENRNYTEKDYDDDRLAYIKITGVFSDIVSFENLSADDVPHVLQMPDSVPFRVSELPTDPIGQVNPNDYDAHARSVLGLIAAPDYETGDILVFYTEEFERLTVETPVQYAQVTGLQGGLVSYILIEKDDIDSYMSVFISRRIENDGSVDPINQSTLDNVRQQAIDSGFVDEAVEQMLQSALKTETIQAALQKNGISANEISGAAGAAATTKNRLEFKLESKKVTPRKIAGDNRHFDGGWGIGLDIRVVFSLEKKVSATVTNSMKIELSASFEQEIAVDLNVIVEDKWEWYFIIPVLEELSCYVAFDVQSFSSISVGARIYSNVDIEPAKWKTITTKLDDPFVQDALQKINKLGVLVKKYKGHADKVKEYLEKIEELREKLPDFDFGNGETLTFEEMEESLGMTDVSTEFEEVLSAEDPDNTKVGLEKLVDRYADMLNQESSWIDLYTVNLLDKDIFVNIVTIKIKIDFTIKVNVNISLGADLEYQTGKRYNFWVHVMARTAGSSEMDLLDERFAFQFYVMGALGLKAGVKAEIAVGVISTQIASIGATVEFGPYLRIYGYFFYTYTKMRPMNSTEWIEDTEQIGALYLEFGLYLIVKFKAQAFQGTFTYNPTLFDREFPLLSVGVQKNVYGFAKEPKREDTQYVTDNDGNVQNGIKMMLPASYRLMKSLDLRKGEKQQEIYDSGHFIYRVSNRNFSIDSEGMITVTPPDNTRYMKCDLTIIWKSDKAAFSKYDISVTVPLVWTDLSDAEQKESFTASFAFGDIINGYRIVESRTYTRMDTFDLPTEEEMLELGGYNNFLTEDGFNLKYSQINGYTTDKTSDISLTVDTTFYFDVTMRKYTLTVNNVKDANGETKSIMYTAAYGDSFNLSNLLDTGANDSSKNLYSAFSHIAKPGEEAAVFDPDTAVNLNFYGNYGTDAVVEAVYTDEALTATYTFLGIDAPEKTVIFKKGTTPYFEDLNDYISEYGGADATLLKIMPAEINVEHDIRYVVHCQPNNPKPKHTLSFETNGGTAIKAQSYPEGVRVQCPKPSRVGYTFDGWYTDVALTEPFEPGPMPENDLTIYAKWKANTYEVILDFKNGTTSTIDVTYDSLYGELPSPEKQADMKFVGWFTEPEEGEEITSETIFQVAGVITLYARWQMKNIIVTGNVDKTQQTYIYDKTEKAFQVDLGAPYTGMTGFVLSYRKAGTNSDYIVGLPINAGTYDIKINRPTDDDYIVMSEIPVPAGLVIEKRMPAITLGELYVSGNVVRAAQPVTDSDGVLTHYLEITDAAGRTGTLESSDGLFTLVRKGTLKYYVKYSEGENYRAVNTYATHNKTAINAGEAQGGYQVSFEIKTADMAGAGTDDAMYGGLFLHSYWLQGGFILSPDLQVSLTGGYDNPFERNAQETYVIAQNIDPWNISNTIIRKEGYSFTGDWDLGWADIIVTGAGGTYRQRFAENKTLVSDTDDVEYWGAPHRAEGSAGFYRTITDVSAFYNGGAGTIDLNAAQSTNYKYSFSGIIKDQFYPGGYNCLTRALGPAITVTSGNSAYDKFIKYTGVASFEIDTAGLAAYISQHGGSNFDYTVTMNFGSGTDATTNRFLKAITVSVPTAVKPSAFIQANKTEAFATAAFAMPINGTLSDTASFVLSAETLGAKKGQIIEVPVNLDSSVPLWGIWGSIDYDTDVLELIGCKIEDMFDESGVTLHKNLSASSYHFLATRTDLDEAAVSGRMFTLTFRVKEDIEDQSSEIVLNILQGINAQGKALDFENKNGVILVDSQVPVISGIENGGVYYTTQVAVVEDTNLQSVTLNGDLTTAPVTLDGNVEAAYSIVAIDKAGHTSTYTVTMKPIASLASEINAIMLENVKSSDKTNIEAVRLQIDAVDTTNATDAEKDALKEWTDKCDALLSKIADTAEELRRVADEVNRYKLEKVKSTDKAALDTLAEDVRLLSASGNLTEEEISALSEIEARLGNLLAKISGTAALISKLTDTIAGYKLDTVKSTDRFSIEQALTDLQELISTENLSEDERAHLETAKTQANALLSRISDAAAAAVKEEIKNAETISKDNVKLDDKNTLLRAKEALESALKVYAGNYTEPEQTALEIRLSVAVAALGAIDNAEKVIDCINALPAPSEIKLNDRDIVYSAKKAYDALTDAEKAMIGTEGSEKLTAVLQALDILEKAQQVPPGDTRPLFPWIILLFVSGGGVIVLKMKRRSCCVRRRSNRV